MKAFLLLAIFPATLVAQQFRDNVVADESVSVPIYAKLNTEYSEAEEGLKRNFRANLIKALNEIDAIVEIYYLESETVELEKHDPDYIFIAPYGSYSKIKKRVILGGKQKTDFISLYSHFVEASTSGGGAFCHYPYAGIRFIKNNEIVSETSFCWKCSNYFVDYPNGSSWTGFPKKSISNKLKEAFDNLLTVQQVGRDNGRKSRVIRRGSKTFRRHRFVSHL